MKVLWFTNTACSAAERMGIKNNRGGWLISLEKIVQNHPDISLSIAFYAPEEMKPFHIGKTRYIPLYRGNKKSKLSRLISRWKGPFANDAPEIDAILRLISRENPDLIHIHGTEDNFGLIQQHCNIPVVVSIQGMLTPYAEKYYSGVPASIASRYMPTKEKLLFKSASRQYKNMRQRAAREQIILSESRHIIGRTDWDRRISKILSPESTYYFNNEILRKSFYTHQWNKQSFEPVLRLVTITSEGLYKGFETIVKTASILQRQPSFPFEWTVIGLQEKNGMVQMIRRWLKENISDVNLSFLGDANEHIIVEKLQAADIYCQVSHIENSPNSLCEAMLLGMPVIASYAGGTSSLVENGTTGLLVQSGDPFALAGTIRELSCNFSQAKKMGANARKKALERHDPLSITNDLASIYHQLTHRIKESVRFIQTEKTAH